MRVALCQMEVAYENKEVNYIKAGRMIESAAAQEAQMILFPEMTFTGFSMNTGITGETKQESPSIHLICGYARQFQVTIGFGVTLRSEEDPTMCENHYMVANPQGEIISDYIKIHPFSYAGEDIRFAKGDELAVFEYEGRSFGIAICYDLRFPELFNALSKKADVLVVAANWPDERIEQWRCLLQARAIENQGYVLGINCVGEFGQKHYSGNSMIIDPKGVVLACRQDEEMILMVDLEDDVLQTRLSFPVKADRREELYRSWYDQEQN